MKVRRFKVAADFGHRPSSRRARSARTPGTRPSERHLSDLPAVDAQAFADCATVERLTRACVERSAPRARHRHAPRVGVAGLQRINRRRVVRVDERGAAAGDDVGPRRRAGVHERVERAALRSLDGDEVRRLERSTPIRGATACATRAPSGCVSTGCVSTGCVSSGCVSSGRGATTSDVPACGSTIKAGDRGSTRNADDRDDHHKLTTHHEGSVLHLAWPGARGAIPTALDGSSSLTPCSRCPSSCARCSRDASTPSTSATRSPAPDTRRAC